MTCKRYLDVGGPWVLKLASEPGKDGVGDRLRLSKDDGYSENDRERKGGPGCLPLGGTGVATPRALASFASFSGASGTFGGPHDGGGGAASDS